MQRISVTVTTEPGGESLGCHAYIVAPPPPPSLPSPQYLAMVVGGAREHGLPAAYVDRLEGVGHNGYQGEVNPP